MWTYFVALGLCATSLCGDESFTKNPIVESNAVEKPQYLYKILSLRHWQASQNRKTVNLSAEDDAFIHFSTEDQLERILKKYWSDASEFVILKVDTSLVEGEWVYESNPGGSTKYYHLYRGFIPFGAIAESKIVYRQSAGSCVCKALNIVQVGDPVLRKTARELSLEEILSPEIQNLIEEMKATMRAAPGVGLAAPQIGRDIQLAVIEDMDQSNLTAEQIAERRRYKVPFHVIINPRLYLEEEDRVEFFEGCLSVPGVMAVVPRAKSVRVECLNERGEPQVIQAEGWYARILQHEIDHLNGVLYLDRSVLRTLMTEENYVKLWRKKTIKEVEADLK